jgi:hypothetical protein
VEVKRSTDTRIRREVVGELLDYAANAVQYWPIETIRQWFEESCGEGLDPNAHLADIIGLTDSTDEAVARFWETVETNLRAGRLRLIFAADEIPPELRRIIEFLDEQMMPAEVLGIEIRQYVGANGHTLVPSVIRSLRRSAPPINTRSAGQWDRGSLLSALLRRKGADILAVAKTTIEWAEKNGLLFSWGRGRFDGSCFLGIMHEGVAYYPVSIWTSGMIQMQFQTLRQRGVTPEMIEKLAAGLRIIPGVEMPPESLNRFPSFKMALLRKPQALEQFLKTVESFLEQVRTETKANPAAATE